MSSLKKENLTNIVPIILSGGIGSRLWPLSQKENPKPFIKILDEISFIQKTFLRAQSIKFVKEIVTVTNRELLDKTKASYDSIAHNTIHTSFILEPFGRNSAPAISVAAQYIKDKYGEDTILLVLPADHLIKNEIEFKKSVDKAISLAKDNKLVTFGITPNSINTGFGHIMASGEKVEQFLEKPNKKKIEALLKTGNLFWNSGIFCMGVNTFCNEMVKHSPLLLSQARKCINNASFTMEGATTQREIRYQDFKEMENISIDYALFEKSNNIFVVKSNIGWSDIGSWTDLGKNFSKDKDQNEIIGQVILKEVENCTIYSDDGIIVGRGLNNLIIAKVGNEILIINKENTNDVREIALEVENYKKEKI